MIFGEFNEEKYAEGLKEEGIEVGLEKGLKKGREEGRVETTIKIFRDKLQIGRASCRERVSSPV